MAPKIELHLHLDCSLSYRAVSQLDPAIGAEEYANDFIAPPRCSSLADFLLRAPRGFQLMQTEAALELVTEDLFEQLAADGVIYAEIRFAPLLPTARGLSVEQVVAAVDRPTARAVRATGLSHGAGDRDRALGGAVPEQPGRGDCLGDGAVSASPRRDRPPSM